MALGNGSFLPLIPLCCSTARHSTSSFPMVFGSCPLVWMALSFIHVICSWMDSQSDWSFSTRDWEIRSIYQDSAPISFRILPLEAYGIQYMQCNTNIVCTFRWTLGTVWMSKPSTQLCSRLPLCSASFRCGCRLHPRVMRSCSTWWIVLFGQKWRWRDVLNLV